MMLLVAAWVAIVLSVATLCCALAALYHILWYLYETYKLRRLITNVPRHIRRDDHGGGR